MKNPRTKALVDECLRHEESCLYTSTGLYAWQKRSRWFRNAFIVAPIILGGLATSQLFVGREEPWANWAAGGFALLAGFFPAIYEALGMNMRVAEIGQSATEFTNLRDRFRQLALIKSQGEFDEFEASFEQLMDRMDAARTAAPPIPESFFRKAQKKINQGDYEFEVDSK